MESSESLPVGKRSRVVTKRTPATTTPPQPSARVQSAGKRLSAIGEVAKNIGELDDEDDVLVQLHSILFGYAGYATSRKRNVLQWRGVDTEHEREKLAAEVATTSIYTILKEMCVILGLDIGDSRPVVEDTIVGFLCQPGAVDSEYVMRSTRRGRKPGGRNRTREEVEAERQAKATMPPAKRGRKPKNQKAIVAEEEMTPRTGLRGRPRKFNELTAFKAFVKDRTPDLLSAWQAMTEAQRKKYWVRRKEDIEEPRNVEAENVHDVDPPSSPDLYDIV